MKTLPFVLMGIGALAIAGCGSKESVKAGEPGTGKPPAAVEAPANAPVLAVSTVQVQNADKTEAGVVTDIIRTELMKLGKWRVIDREHMDEALRGQVLALAGVSSDADAVHLGKLLNAQLMGIGTYGKFMEMPVVTFRIVEVETGLAKYAGTAQGKNIDALRKEIAKMVQGFAK